MVKGVLIDDVWKLTLAPYQKVLFKELYFWHVKGELKHTEFLAFWSVHTFFPHQNWNFSKFCFVKPLEYKRFFCLLNKECILSFTWNICRVFFPPKVLIFCLFFCSARRKSRAFTTDYHAISCPTCRKPLLSSTYES